jgi:hypothetical protein
MQSALDQFRISIQRVRDLIALHNSVKAQATAALDLSDILRAALNIGNRWYIDESMVGDTVDFLEQVVESIHQIL